jgi:hypothetical protein
VTGRHFAERRLHLHHVELGVDVERKIALKRKPGSPMPVTQ